MKTEIKIPAMGESVSSATISSLLKPSGSQVSADDEIIELETEKVNQMLYAPKEGILNWEVTEGDSVKIGQVIGTIESAQEVKQPESTQSPQPQKVIEPILKPPLPGGKSAEPGARVTKEASIAHLLHPKVQEKEELQETKIPVEPIPQQSQELQGSRRKMSKLRRVIAERLVEVQQTTASLTTFNEVDLSQILLLRETYKESFEKRHGVRLGFMSFFVKAVVSALQKFPDFNSYIEADEIVQRASFDIGVAVGTDKGVFVPVVRNCNALSYFEIEKAIGEYAKKAKEGRLVADDLQGGGFTITNGGVYGSLLSTPILNPPQCAILGMHKIEKRPVVVDNVVVIRPMMYVALTYDHRLVDGKEAVSFLVHIKDRLEEPMRQVLDV